MIELLGKWSEEDIGIYLKNNPNKVVVEETRLFVSDLNE